MKEVRSKINALLSEVFEIPKDDISESSSFDELGLDSLDALRLVAHIERRFGVEIPEDDIPRVRIVGDLYSMLDQRLAV